MIKRIAVMLAPMACMGCATAQLTDEQATPLLAGIEFATEPCFGFCPSFTIAVSANGHGTYEGISHVKERGPREFTVSQAEFAAFRDRLSAFRPATSQKYDYDNCDGPVATDNPSVRVTWNDGGGKSVTLDWYMGCRQPGLSDRSDQIYQAWETLPIMDLVGTDEDRREYGGF